MTVLTLAVIALALFLGWMMGYVRSPRGPVGTKTKAAVNATALPVQAKPPEGTVLSASAAVHRDQPTPASPTTELVGTQHSGSQPSAAGVPPVGQPVTVPSKVADEYLVQRVEPEYPEPAREQHIQGPVVLEALVGKDGAVEKLNTISGDSQLVAAATDAVRQWRFKPFFRNGSPEEFQTRITVSFRLP
jgi:protein TonB